MALSEDQRAMLQLILERDQSYEDIGSLLGLEVGEVRTRARAALTEIGGADPDADVALTDYLLGQADPIGRADAARHLQADPEANELARKLEAQLRLLAPKADLPTLPAAAAGRTAPEAGGDDDAPASSQTTVSTGQKRLIAALLGGGVVVALIVLAITGAFSGGGGGSDATTPTTADTTSTSPTTASNTKKPPPTTADLTSTTGGKERGAALFASYKQRPVVVLRATGLDPAPAGESYLVWLRAKKGQSVRIGAAQVKKGGLLAVMPVPTKVIELVAGGVFDTVEVSLASISGYKTEVEAAKKAKRLPNFTGTSVMRGEIKGPLVSKAAAAAASQGSSPQQGQGAP